MIYYNLRCNLIEQPVPKGMGHIGHWQNPVAGGTPRIMPHIERAFISQSMREIESPHQDVRAIEYANLDYDERLQALDFAAAMTADDEHHRPYGQVNQYDVTVPNAKDSLDNQSGESVEELLPFAPAQKYEAPLPDPTIGHGFSKSAETENGEASDNTMDGDKKACRTKDKAHAGPNGKRPRGSSSPKEEKSAKIKTEAKTEKDSDAVLYKNVCGDEARKKATLCMNSTPLELRGGGGISESTATPSPGPPVRGGSRRRSEIDDWYALITQQGEETCRFRKRDW